MCSSDLYLPSKAYPGDQGVDTPKSTSWGDTGRWLDEDLKKALKAAEEQRKKDEEFNKKLHDKVGGKKGGGMLGSDAKLPTSGTGSDYGKPKQGQGPGGGGPGSGGGSGGGGGYGGTGSGYGGGNWPRGGPSGGPGRASGGGGWRLKVPKGGGGFGGAAGGEDDSGGGAGGAGGGQGDCEFPSWQLAKEKGFGAWMAAMAEWGKCKAAQGLKAVKNFFFGHTGGIVTPSGIGSNNARIAPRPVVMSQDTIKSIPRYATGGIAGLKPDEVPAILHKGEEVITQADPRHRDNGAAGAPGTSGKVKIVNTFDAQSFLAESLATEAGENVILNAIRANAGAVKEILEN